MKPQIKAFIFDLDGVITDTAEYHYLAWKRLAEELGVEFNRGFNEELKGISRMASLEKILVKHPDPGVFTDEEKHYLADKKNVNYKLMVKEMSPEDVLPGIIPLLDEIRTRDIRLALGSASKNAQLVLSKLELTHYFDYVVNAAEIKKGKPDPETFTAAADHFGLVPESCIGVEDARSGVEAIKRAGMFAVGVGSADQLHEADLVVDKTDKLRLEHIMNEYERAVAENGK